MIPALARYPEVFAGLLSLGDAREEIDYTPWAERLGWHVSELIEMVLDEDLNWREEDDPALWAPIHAMRILALIGPVDAAEPLLECMEWEEDWYEELVTVYGRIGPAAIPLLRVYLYDPDHTVYARGRAVSSLAAIAQSHPDARARWYPCSLRSWTGRRPMRMLMRKRSPRSSSATWAI